MKLKTLKHNMLVDIIHLRTEIRNAFDKDAVEKMKTELTLMEEFLDNLNELTLEV